MSDDLPAFEIDDRIFIRLERKLGEALGALILDTSTENTALLALGHQLRNLTNVHEVSTPSSRGIEADDGDDL